MQIQIYGGINALGEFLEALVLVPGFHAGVVSLGVVRDAERPREGTEPRTNDAEAATVPRGRPMPVADRAFQSVANTLRSVGLTEPLRPGERTDSTPCDRRVHPAR